MAEASSTETDLAGRKALIAGASGGMGRAVALALAREGVACALMGQSRERLAQTAEACAGAGPAPLTVTCDLARTGTIAGAVREAIARLGGLNFVVNCAGIHRKARADADGLTEWDAVVDVNLKATYHIALHALPEINKAPGGALIKIGSVPASYPGAGAFLATTRGIDGFADALFEDVREHGTKICTIRPGYVNTRMATSDRLDPARMIQPEDIARTVLYVLAMPGTACPTEITLRPQRSPYR